MWCRSRKSIWYIADWPFKAHLFLTKLQAYRFDNESLVLVQNCLSNRKQRTKVGQNLAHGKKFIWFSTGFYTWFHFFQNLPLWSLYYHEWYCYSKLRRRWYTASAENTKWLANSLENNSCRIFKWFWDQLKRNGDECQVLLNTNEKVAANVD